MSHIILDPFDSNTLRSPEQTNPSDISKQSDLTNPTNPTNPSNPTALPLGGLNGRGLGMHDLQGLMQAQLLTSTINNLSFLKTNNPLVDTLMMSIIQMLIIFVVSSLITKIGSIGSIGMSGITYVFNLLYRIFEWLGNILWRKRKTYSRKVDIPLISDTKQLNELYKAVYWYLTQDKETDYLHEPYLQYIFDKKISPEQKDHILNNLSIHKILAQQQTKKIKFRKHEITYSMKTDLITVYTDKDRKKENYVITLWATIDEMEKSDVLEEFCHHCLNEYIKNLTSTTWTQMIYTNVQTEWKATKSNNLRKLETVVLKNGLMMEIKNDLQMFLNSEDWYKERDIPYTRGYLFYGHPGTGKTSIIKAMSNFCKRHIHFLLLSEVKSDTELIELLKKIPYKDTILVIEDIDAMSAIVKSRNTDVGSEHEPNPNPNQIDNILDPNPNPNPKSNVLNLTISTNPSNNFDNLNLDSKPNYNSSTLTLSGLLNAIDGVFDTHGRILIMTTNHPEVLDDALIRPGRVDSKFLFDYCDKKQIKELFQMYFNIILEDKYLENIQNEKYSPAQITSVFLRYRNKPLEALEHLDDQINKIKLTKLD